MNLFVIPSWYPSASDPNYGIFNYEQVRLMSGLRPNWNIGVSRWGQGDDPFLLPIRSSKSLFKLTKNHNRFEEVIAENLIEYFSPAYSWTRKFKKGNINGIIKANELNMDSFVKKFGKPDLISAQASYPAAVVAYKLSKKYKVPYTVTIRMSPFPFEEFMDSGKLKPLLEEPLSKANKLIATSNSLKNRLIEFDFKNVAVINNPVDLSLFETEKAAQKNRILMIGRMEEQKGVDLLLKALSQVKEPFELRIGGDGSLLSSYKSLATDLGMQSRISWLGELSRSQVAEEMKNCDFYILSSRHETFGNVLLEAMASGKPVVATRCGGPEEIVSNRTGILCEPSVDGLKNGINEMMNRREEFDANVIRGEVTDRFAPEVWVERLENLFKSLL